MDNFHNSKHACRDASAPHNGAGQVEVEGSAGGKWLCLLRQGVGRLRSDNIWGEPFDSMLEGWRKVMEGLQPPNHKNQAVAGMDATNQHAT
jgi:hypothetical protein